MMPRMALIVRTENFLEMLQDWRNWNFNTTFTYYMNMNFKTPASPAYEEFPECDERIYPSQAALDALGWVFSSITFNTASTEEEYAVRKNREWKRSNCREEQYDKNKFLCGNLLVWIKYSRAAIVRQLGELPIHALFLSCDILVTYYYVHGFSAGSQSSNE